MTHLAKYNSSGVADRQNVKRPGDTCMRRESIQYLSSKLFRRSDRSDFGAKDVHGLRDHSGQKCPIGELTLNRDIQLLILNSG
jgi:hypothetical protein